VLELRIPASSLFGFGSVGKLNVSLFVFAGRDFLKKLEIYEFYPVTSNSSMRNIRSAINRKDSGKKRKNLIK
jgi:hypothetical protein